jgi:DNA-binding transcriptional MocR family regulator
LGHSIGFEIDPRRGEPLHRQIFDEVVARIRTRTFPPGFKLPPTRVLAKELSTHRNTVARAYADLEAAGFVTGSVGRGTFVEAEARGTQRRARLEAVDSGRAIAWSSLLAETARPEVLGRAERWARRVDDRDVVNLARMQPSPDLLPAESIRRCITHVSDASVFSYAPDDGVPRLRRAIAGELVSRGVPVGADDVLVTSGSQQALDIVVRALVRPGETILVEATTYSGAIDVFRLAGARIVAVPCDDEGPDPAALERLARSDVKALYVMPTGHNPSGRTIPNTRRRAIAAWSRDKGIPIIEDDYVAGITLDEDGPDPVHLRALSRDVIHLSTFSKRLAPAFRLGYIIAPPELRSALRSMKRVVDLGCSALLQHALAEFIERGWLTAHVTKASRTYRSRRDALARALRKTLPPSVELRVPSHGMAMWLSLPSSIDPQALYEEALRQGVLVSPSPMWSVDAPSHGGVRLTFCAEEEGRLIEGARRLGKAFRLLGADSAPELPRVFEAV